MNRKYLYDSLVLDTYKYHIYQSNKSITKSCLLLRLVIWNITKELAFTYEPFTYQPLLNVRGNQILANLIFNITIIVIIITNKALWQKVHKFH